MEQLIEYPTDPHVIAAALDNVPDESIRLDPVPAPPSDWLPAGVAMVRRSFVVHGRTHTVTVARIVSSRPAHLTTYTAQH